MDVDKYYSPSDVSEYEDGDDIPTDPDEWTYTDYRHELMFALHGAEVKDNGIIVMGDCQYPLVPVEVGYADEEDDTLRFEEAIDDLRDAIDEFDPEDPPMKMGGTEADPEKQLDYYRRIVRLFEAMQDVELEEVRRYNSDPSKDYRSGDDCGVSIAVWNLTDATSAVIVREETKSSFFINTRHYVEITRKPEKKIEAVRREHPHDTVRETVVPMTAEAAKPVPQA